MVEIAHVLGVLFWVVRLAAVLLALGLLWFAWRFQP
jgi:hypothetical protein